MVAGCGEPLALLLRLLSHADCQESLRVVEIAFPFFFSLLLKIASKCLMSDFKELQKPSLANLRSGN